MLLKFFHIKYMILLIILINMVISTYPVYANNSAMNNYTLSPNENIRVLIKGEKNLSGTYLISNNGTINMPIIGKVKIAGETIQNARKRIISRLKDGYIRNPEVTVKVINSPSTAIINSESNKHYNNHTNKKIYIVGEINNPGYYKLPSNAAHILNIIALAGGYTDKANKESFEIVRNINGVYYRKKSPVGALTYHDGDIIIIKERF